MRTALMQQYMQSMPEGMVTMSRVDEAQGNTPESAMQGR